MTSLADLEDRVCHNRDVMFGFMAAEPRLAGRRAEGGMTATMRHHLEPRPLAQS